MPSASPNTRLEALCDGVFAIAVTLLVIEVRIPAMEPIDSTAALWRSLIDLLPAVLAFVLSFVVIFITWFNHHSVLELINKSSPSFLYANGFLLFTVAIVPFPTALLGEYVLSDHAAPAVSLYAAVLAMQGTAWILVCHTALSNGLAKSDRARARVRENRRYGYTALTLYALLAAVALRFPKVVAGITAATWGFWLVLGIMTKTDEQSGHGA